MICVMDGLWSSTLDWECGLCLFDSGRPLVASTFVVCLRGIGFSISARIGERPYVNQIQVQAVAIDIAPIEGEQWVVVMWHTPWSQ
jgi:hypothetical protein